MRLDYQILLKSQPPNVTGWVRPAVNMGILLYSKKSTHKIAVEWVLQPGKCQTLCETI